MKPAKQLGEAVRFRALLAVFDSAHNGVSDVFTVLHATREGLSRLAAPNPPDLDAEIRYVISVIAKLYNEGLLDVKRTPHGLVLTPKGLNRLAQFVRANAV